MSKLSRTAQKYSSVHTQIKKRPRKREHHEGRNFLPKTSQVLLFPSQGKQKTYVNQFLLDSSRKLAYCHFPKVATTTTFKIMGRLLGFNQSHLDDMDKKSVSTSRLWKRLNARAKDSRPDLLEVVKGRVTGSKVQLVIVRIQRIHGQQRPFNKH